MFFSRPLQRRALLLLSAAGLSTSAAAAQGFDGSHSRLERMLEHNAAFVKAGSFQQFAVASPAPATRCVILTCMDSRLVHLLPAALDIKQGEAKIIKTAGAILSHPFGGVMRSIVVALFELKASEVFIIGHDDCGMSHVKPEDIQAKMLAAGVPPGSLSTLEASGVDVNKWLQGFSSVDESVQAAVKAVQKHPLVPPGLRVTGLIINPVTGALRLPGSARAEPPHRH